MGKGNFPITNFPNNDIDLKKAIDMRKADMRKILHLFEMSVYTIFTCPRLALTYCVFSTIFNRFIFC